LWTIHFHCALITAALAAALFIASDQPEQAQQDNSNSGLSSFRIPAERTNCRASSSFVDNLNATYLTMADALRAARGHGDCIRTEPPNDHVITAAAVGDQFKRILAIWVAGQSSRGGAVLCPTGTRRADVNRKVILNSPPTGKCRPIGGGTEYARHLESSYPPAHVWRWHNASADGWHGHVSEFRNKSLVEA
jgi:hypothetical protein